MSDSNGPTSQFFKKTQSGRIAFHPWGILGRGYVTPNRKARVILRRFVSAYALISIPVFYIAERQTSILVIVAVLAIVLGVYHIITRLLTRGMARTADRLTLAKWALSIAESHGLLVIWGLEAFLLIMSWLSVLVLGRNVHRAISGLHFTALPSPPYEDLLIPLVGVVCFGFCTLLLGYAVVIKMRQLFWPDANDRTSQDAS